MYSRVLIVVVALTSGCEAQLSRALRAGEFVRSANRDECWQYPSKTAFLITPSPELERVLVQRTRGQALKVPRCWFGDRSGRIALIAGVPCENYDEFQFERRASAWKLVASEQNDFVTCEERATAAASPNTSLERTRGR
jgi:hypothetical protein